MRSGRYRETPGWRAAIAAGAIAWVVFLIRSAVPATVLGSTIFGEREGWWPGWVLAITIFWAALPALLVTCALTPLLVTIARQRERLLSWWLVSAIALLGAAPAALGVLGIFLPFVPLIAVDREDPGGASSGLVATALIGYMIAGAVSAVACWLVLVAVKSRADSASASR